MAGHIGLVGSALALFVLLAGCAGRHQVSVSGPRLQHPPAAMNTSADETAADRVKDAVQSLRRELKRGGSMKPLPADLTPIPLISTSRAERVVGTAGVWTVIETTQRTSPSHNVVAHTHTQYRDSPGSHPARWFLLVAGALGIAAIVALNHQARKNRTRQQ
jgi:hypothetical protein